MLNALVRRIARRPAQAPVTLREPLRLVGGSVLLAVGETLRRDLEIKLGPGVAYPAPGWHTWTVPGASGETRLLSTFFRSGKLIAVEYYLAKTANVPRYAPKARAAFALEPGGIGLGAAMRSLGRAFAGAATRPGGVGAVVYQDAREARWSAGVALVSGNDGRIERIALYVG